MEKTKWAIVVLLALAVAQAVAYYPQLPDVVASHFDGSGHPNGWMSKTEFIAIDLVVLVLIAVLFLWIPVGIGRIPLHLWSLPNRQYWLAPERRDETRRIFDVWMGAFGIATILLLLAAFQLAIQANLNPPAILSPILTPILVAYFAFTGIWTVLFYRRFAGVPTG